VTITVSVIRAFPDILPFVRTRTSWVLDASGARAFGLPIASTDPRALWFPGPGTRADPVDPDHLGTAEGGKAATIRVQAERPDTSSGRGSRGGRPPGFDPADYRGRHTVSAVPTVSSGIGPWSPATAVKMCGCRLGWWSDPRCDWT